ncbi:multidrug effflux MFS transporter [Pseudomaricurvus alkylphenolicus]|uniref:MFS transporter n=1 Tax=Pseudomaricurvus alkylphenolicus TaxID=1306991 RepID=UPI001422B158|nr:MFS transporter [Pseudomaricurvus alkylphenolicus]NIB40959.1 multidrug effflux MFS transporter [Pseudomaricurvus alkylphenolicus]
MTKFQIILYGLLFSIAALGIDGIVPSLGLITQGLGTTAEDGSLIISAFVVGMATGEFLAGPLSDAYGRSRILLWGLGLFAVATVGCALSDSLSSMLVMRAIQGLGAGAASAQAALLIGDRFDLEQTARLISSTFVVAMAVRVVTPIAGFSLSSHWGWSWLFVTFLSLTILLIIYFRRESKLIRAPFKPRPFSLSQVQRDCRQVLADRFIQLYIGAEIATSIGLFCYLAAASNLMVEYVGFAQHQFSYIYATGTALMMAAAFLNNRWVSKAGLDNMMLLTSIPLTVISIVFLLLIIWPWGNSMIVAVLMLASLMPIIIIRINANSGCIKRFPKAAGAASSLHNAVGLLVGAGAGAICGRIFQGTPLALAIALMICAVLCLLCSLELRSGRKMAPHTEPKRG